MCSAKNEKRVNKQRFPLSPHCAVKVSEIIVQLAIYNIWYRVPTEIQKHNSMIFHDQQCNFHDYLMHGLQPPLLALSINGECSNNSMHVDHACILKLLKLETTSSQKTSCWTLTTGGFLNLFHKIPSFFHDYSGFLKFHDFSMHGIYFSDFPGFPELVGTLLVT